MFIINKVNLLGRLTKDPELRYSANNNSTVWVTFTLAVNRRFTKQGEERQADFINILAFGKTAEFCAKYFGKGQQVAISGRIQTRTWDDQDGKKRYATEVIAEDVYFADSKKEQSSQQENHRIDQTPQQAMPKDDFFDEENDSDDVPF